MLLGAQFSDTEGVTVNFANSTIIEVDFHNANLFNVNFTHATLSNATFPDATLIWGEFHNADLQRIEFPGADLSRAEFPDADLQRAEFTEADLRRATLDDAVLLDATLNYATIEDASLEGVDLRGANLQDARLYQAYFADVRLNSDTEFGDTCGYDGECAIDTDDEDDWPWDDTTLNEAAVWTYRRLEDLHKQYAQIEDARHYHKQKEKARKQLHREQGNWSRWAVYAVNGFLSEHGENPWRVVQVSLYTILVCGLIYPFIGGMARSTEPTEAASFDVLPTIPITAPEPVSILLSNVYFSAVTFTTLGYGDIQPASSAVEALATVGSLS